MSHICELTGKSFQYGNHVSHANNKTRRRFLLNLCNVKLFSNILSKKYNLRISAKTLRLINRFGSLDIFLLKYKSKKLSTTAKLIKNNILKKEKKCSSSIAKNS